MKSSLAADLSCFYIKQNTHTETDVLFRARPTAFLFHPTNPTYSYPGKGRDNEKLGRVPGAVAAPAPVLVLLSFTLRPPAWLLHLVCITSHFHLTSLDVGSKALR